MSVMDMREKVAKYLEEAVSFSGFPWDWVRDDPEAATEWYEHADALLALIEPHVRTIVAAQLREQARWLRAKAENTSYQGEADFRPGIKWAAEALADEADTVEHPDTTPISMT